MSYALSDVDRASGVLRDATRLIAGIADPSVSVFDHHMGGYKTTRRPTAVGVTIGKRGQALRQVCLYAGLAHSVNKHYVDEEGTLHVSTMAVAGPIDFRGRTVADAVADYNQMQLDQP
jgi:hypothetical protein